jgi:uncharacterized protein (DUF433 family)
MSVESVIRAFSADHVIRLTGLSKRQLDYWDDTGFFKPLYAFDNRRSPYSRIYSFRDVVGLRVISVLRKQYKIPLQYLRTAAKALSQYTEAPWSELTLFVFGKEVLFREPDTGVMRGALSKQYVNLPLRSIIEDVAERSNKLRERTTDHFGNVIRNRFVAHNAWVVAGTRIPIAAINRFVKAGYSTKQIIREYPSLTEKDVEAAIKHKAKLAKTA